VRDNPQEGADLVRAALFNGVDIVPNLVGETVTGGRLNAFNSLILLMDSCLDENICLPPVGFEASLEGDTTYTLTWTSLSEGQNTSLRFRPIGTEEWTVVSGLPTDTLILDTLQNCTAYEFELGAACAEGEEISFSQCLVINTLGCCLASDELIANEVFETETSVSWTTNFNIPAYNLFYKELGAENWILYETYTANDTTAVIEGLELCTEYEILINPACADSASFGTTLEIRTKGCGACIDNPYCDNFGESSDDEFILSVEIGEYEFETGNNGGYALFEDFNIILGLGQEYPVTLTPGFSGTEYDEFFKIWIDANQDGEFTEDELMMSSEEGSPEVVQDTILIPETALQGNTRMRISMKYVGGFFIPDDVAACEVFGWGETEDYCISLADVTSVEENDQVVRFNLFPNPASEQIFLDYELIPSLRDGAQNMRIFDISGKVLKEIPVNSGNNSIALGDLSQGIYMYTLTNRDGTTLKAGKFVLNR
jgi:hypothetical protein